MTMISEASPDLPRELSKLFKVFYAPKALIGFTANTHTKYEIAISHLRYYLGHEPTIDDLDDDTIAAWMRWMTTDGMGYDATKPPGLGLSPHTANSYGSKIVAMWGLLGRKNIAGDLPFVRRLRAPRRSPIGWSDDELRILFKACSELPGSYCGIPARLWWVCMHSIILQTGERIGALLQCEWQNYNKHTRVLRRPAEIRKWKMEDMTTILDADVAFGLELIRYPERNLIFPFPFHRSTLWNHHRRILQNAGLPDDRLHMFHCERKSSGSKVKSLGGDAQRHLGHQDAATTDRYMVPEIVGEEFDTSELIRNFSIRDYLNAA